MKTTRQIANEQQQNPTKWDATPLPSVEEIQDKMSSLRAKFVSKKIGYAKWANGVDKLLTQRDNQAYTSLVEGIEGMKGVTRDWDTTVKNNTLIDILENVVKPLYGKE